MFATRRVLEKVRFTEDMLPGEDVEWAHQAIKHFGLQKFKVITNTWLITSSRRFEEHGYLNIILRWAKTWPFGLITGKKDEDYFNMKL